MGMGINYNLNNSSNFNRRERERNSTKNINKNINNEINSPRHSIKNNSFLNESLINSNLPIYHNNSNIKNSGNPNIIPGMYQNPEVK